MTIVRKDYLSEQASVSPESVQPFPSSRKVYETGARPGVRVPMREISLTDTHSTEGVEKNDRLALSEDLVGDLAETPAVPAGPPPPGRLEPSGTPRDDGVGDRGNTHRRGSQEETLHQRTPPATPPPSEVLRCTRTRSI